MNKEFGVPLNDTEANKLKTINCEKETTSLKNLEGSIRNDLFDNTTSYMNSNNDQKVVHTSRVWTPIDHLNVSFIAYKKDKKENTRDFIGENSRKISEISEINRYI